MESRGTNVPVHAAFYGFITRAEKTPTSRGREMNRRFAIKIRTYVL